MSEKPAAALTCEFRASLDEEWSICRIAQAASAPGFGRVHCTLCAACQAKGRPSVEAPNEYLASAILGGAIDAFKAGRLTKRAADAVGRRMIPHLGRAETDEAAVRRPDPCFWLGRKLDQTPGRVCMRGCPHECDRFADRDGLKLVVLPAGQCETCTAYEPIID